MRYEGKAKIGRLSAKPNSIYPQIRLPPKYANLVGTTAHIYAGKHEKKKAFLLVLEYTEKNKHIGKGSVNEVLQFNPEVVKFPAEVSFESRLSALASEIESLDQL